MRAPLTDYSRTCLVKSSDKVSEQILDGQVTGLLQVTLGPQGIEVTHTGVSLIEAAGMIQFAQANIMRKMLL